VSNIASAYEYLIILVLRTHIQDVHINSNLPENIYKEENIDNRHNEVILFETKFKAKKQISAIQK
jgi:hypothetical protein